MRRWAAFFLLIALAAAIVGFKGIPTPWAEIAKAISLVALVLFLASLIASVVVHRRPPSD